MMEIGGYIEIEHNRGSLFHEEAIKLNCGRCCLEYLIEAYEIEKIWLPYFLCNSVYDRCRSKGIKTEFYSVNMDFSVNMPDLSKNDWLYIVNYYGQIDNDLIEKIRKRHTNIIVDNAQAFFQAPLDGVATLYSCRKYLGVSDGAFLYTSKQIKRELQKDESYDRFEFLLGRYENNASDFYEKYVANNELFAGEEMKSMSGLTENMLRGIDYDYVLNCRSKNWEVLSDLLSYYNGLKLKKTEGPFAYPFLCKDGERIRKILISKKIYIPLLWPNVLNDGTDLEKEMAINILPLPCDQRYTDREMEYIAKTLIELLS